MAVVWVALLVAALVGQLAPELQRVDLEWLAQWVLELQQWEPQLLVHQWWGQHWDCQLSL